MVARVLFAMLRSLTARSRLRAAVIAGLALSPVVGCQCEAPAVLEGVEILRLGSVNIVLIDRPGGRFLVDSGARGADVQILAELEARGLELGDFTGLLLTHAHNDHAGAAAVLQEGGLPIWIHDLDTATLAAGKDPPAEVIGAEAAVVDAVLDHTFDPLVADFTFTDDLELFEIGAVVEHVGGHTPGSIAVVVDETVALVGDLLRGGVLGGAAFADIPQVHYFHEDKAEAHQALRELLQRHPDVETIWAAHGGPFPRAKVEEFLASLPE